MTTRMPEPSAEPSAHPPPPGAVRLPSTSSLQEAAFLALIVAITLAFGWILSPYSGAILWGTVLAILFAPLDARLVKAIGRKTPAALLTLLIIVVLVVVPLVLVGIALVDEAVALVTQVRSGEINPADYVRELIAAMPAWMSNALQKVGLGNLAAIQERLTSAMLMGSQAVGTKALSVGSDALDWTVSLFVMLYLLFFLLRDGNRLAPRIVRAIPLRNELLRDLSEQFMVVIRATMKGNVIVAMIQGALGGVLFMFLGIHAPVLWGVLMAFLSLLPAVGAALVWLPVAIYYLATGAVGTGFFVIGYGVFVIGLIDNVLRPILVGKDTKMPDYVVLLSTLGGMAIFGFNGFVIGPVIAAMFLAIWEIFSRESNGSASSK